MAPKLSSTLDHSSAGKDRWVNVTWMPHTAISLTSHVGFTIRSAHAATSGRERSLFRFHQKRQLQQLQYPSLTEEVMEDWTVRVQVYGVGDLPLIPIASSTPAAQATPPHGVGLSTAARRNSGTAGDIDNGSKTTGDEKKGYMPVIRPAATVAGGKNYAINQKDYVWDYQCHLPIRWRDLPRDAYLFVEILGQSVERTDSETLYRGTLPFFSKYGRLQTGLQRIRLQSGPLDEHRNYGLYPIVGTETTDNTTPVEGDGDDDDDEPVWKASLILDQLSRIEARPPVMPTSFGQIPAVPWLDSLTKERAQQVWTDAMRARSDSSATMTAVSLFDPDQDDIAILIVELPDFDIPILHEETFYPIPQHGASGAVTAMDLAVFRKQMAKKKALSSTPETSSIAAMEFDPLQLVPFLEYEDEASNPVEDKYRTLAHDLLRGLVDPALKPDREQRARLAAIIESPSHHPTREEKDLLWRFRFSLVDNRRALTKFLLAVDWTVDSEVVQAAELLEQWRKRSPIEVTDALKLLGKNVAFQTNLVRSYAIDTLAAAPDSELRLYLLQLVQALKFENRQAPDPTTAAAIGPTRGPPSPQSSIPVSSLATFLINRAANNMHLATFLYWYLKVEIQHPSYGPLYRDVFAALKARLSETSFTLPFEDESGTSADSVAGASFRSIVDTVSSKIGSTLLGTDSSSPAEREHRSNPRRRTMWDVLVEQDEFISGILNVQQRCREARGKKDAKEAELRILLAKEGFDRSAQRLPVPLPSSPEILVDGVNPETVAMFKSALYPALVEFRVAGRIPSESRAAGSSASPSIQTFKDSKWTSFKVIVKTGDDLRQDQLVIMMIQLMDRLLRRAALDLCLTPYSIIATSPTSGLVEFVDGAMPISQILAKYNGSILQFFQTVAASPPTDGASKYGIRPDVMSTYIRSCAGYCVITYLLGVGDRHLDNIMIRSTGYFFHIDFGYILGQDPKPLPPAFRLTREMVDAMGGVDSSEYRQFCSLACQGYNALRKSAGLVLNLLHLMSDAGIDDLSNNPSADAESVINRCEERFRLDLSDEQAERYFIGLINDCLAAIAPRVMDVFHSFAVSRR